MRGAAIGMVYQDPMTSLNPMMRIGAQVKEGLTAHGWSSDDAGRRTLEVLGEVGLPSPARDCPGSTRTNSPAACGNGC